MANQSVLELAVGTGKWDAGLRKAKQSLDNFTQANGGLEQALNKESDKMQQFVRMMGQMDSTAKTAKGQMNDYKATIEQLTMQYNRMSDAQKQVVGQDYLNSIDQMKQKYQGVAEEVKKINESLASTSSSGGEGGGSIAGMLQVFGGNMMTKAAEYIAGLGSEVVQVTMQSMQLAREAEGVTNAFARLNQPGLLDNLKEATHGTVSELELMKAAVKFEDFKLPVEELGTMLAFAQQKAKDTGQSVDYMVDSIVTGLGRKSLMILDNLGISAAQVKDKMKETGDMTKAVGEIIREEMAKAGEYVDTTSDQMSRANAKLEDEMLALGRAMQDTFGISGVDELATKIKTELVGAITFTIETINEAKSAWQGFLGLMGIGSGKKQPSNSHLNAPRPNGTYVEQTDSDGNVRAGHWYNGQIAWDTAGVEIVGTKRDKTKKTGGGGRSGRTQSVMTMSDFQTTMAKASLSASSLKVDEDKNFKSVWKMIGESGRKQIAEMADKQWDYGKDISKTANNTPKDIKKMSEGMTKYIDTSNKMLGGISSIASGISSMGIELPKEIQGVLGGIQGVMSILSGIATIVAVIEALTTIQTTESTIKAIPVVGWALAGGGIVHAAGGYSVPGNHYSGDMVPAMLNSGELVLNKAQQGVLASQLQGGGLQNMRLEGVITGENLHIIHNRYLQRTGQGELVTW